MNGTRKLSSRNVACVACSVCLSVLQCLNLKVSGGSSGPPTVMVPVGVLKRKGSNKGKSNKSVMFCDGIRPGSDLTSLDSDFSYNESKMPKKVDSESSVSILICPILKLMNCFMF